MRRSNRPVRLALGLFLALGCSSEGDDGGNGPNPAIALALAASAASAAQGGAAQVGATLTRSGGFTGTVALTVEGVPAGVTGSVSNVQTTGGTTTATVTVSVAASTVPGIYNLTVRATGSGVTAATAPFALTVTAATPDYALSVNPLNATIPQGGSQGNIVVTITRTNFPGAVLLSLGGPVPSGVTATFNPPSTSGGTSAMTITLSGAAPTGVYQLEIVGLAGPGQRTTPFTLTIVAP